jgi:hypothetical protein
MNTMALTEETAPHRTQSSVIWVVFWSRPQSSAFKIKLPPEIVAPFDAVASPEGARTAEDSMELFTKVAYH